MAKAYTILGQAINWHNRETNASWIVCTVLDEEFANAVCEEFTELADRINEIAGRLDQVHITHPTRTGQARPENRERNRQIRKTLEENMNTLTETLRNRDTHVFFIVDCDLVYGVHENELISPRY